METYRTAGLQEQGLVTTAPRDLQCDSTGDMTQTLTSLPIPMRPWRSVGKC
uniref:Uncharacterized protein n=1 Tax=Anguilla anguilla TaxID=7936 RepID=A0A0E9Q5K7_ANGAN